MSIRSEATRRAADEQGAGIADPWRLLSGEEGRKKFASSWLGLTCSAQPSIKAGAVYLADHDKKTAEKDSPVAIWTREGASTKTFLADADRLVRELRLNLASNPKPAPFIETTEEGRNLAIVPLIVDGTFIGGLVTAADITSQQAGARLLRHMQWSIGWLEAESLRGRVLDQSALEEHATAILEAISLVSRSKTYKQATRTLAGYLAKKLDAVRVGVGATKRGRSRLISLSHSATFERSMQVSRKIEAVMDEAADLEQAMLFAHRRQTGSVQSTALKALADNRPQASILALPISSDNGIMGAVVIEWEKEQGIEQSDINLVDAIIAAIAPMLEDKKERSRSTLSVLTKRVGQLVSFILGPRALGWKLVLIALVAGLNASLMLETEMRISANSIVEGKVRRIMSAPFDGFIRSVAIGPGETARKGEVLAELDDSDLAIQRLRLVSRKRQYVLEMDKATADRDLAQSNILKAQIAQADAELSLTEDMLARTRITAPFDGVVVSGDLSQSIGKPVGRGDELFELAPLDHFRITALVAQSDVHLVKPGARGTVLFSALPETSYPFTIHALTATARPADGVNGFEIVAYLDKDVGRIRPGMEGVARIEAGSASYFVIWTRSFWHWLRLQLWAWWP